MYSPITIANFFLQKSFDIGVRVTPMKLLKLVYIAHGWHLGFFKESLITEQAEAWKYGPVVKSVYDAFKKYGRNDINSLCFDTILQKQEYYELLKSDKVGFLNSIWKVYHKYIGLDLSSMTHKEGTPWFITWQEKGSNSIIPNNIIKEYYCTEIEKDVENKKSAEAL